MNEIELQESSYNCSYFGCDKQAYYIDIKVSEKEDKIHFCFNHFHKCIKQEIDDTTGRMKMIMVKDLNGWSIGYLVLSYKNYMFKEQNTGNEEIPEDFKRKNDDYWKRYRLKNRDKIKKYQKEYKRRSKE